MHDNLNLKQLAKEANRLKLWARFSTFIGFSILILSLLTVFASGNSLAQIVVRNGNQWQTITDYPSTICGLQTDGEGTTWLLTNNPITLNRWTGDRWESYKPINDDENSNNCQLVVYMDDKWIVSDKGISRFDGQKWTNYPEAVRTNIVSMTASSLGVYAIDSGGNLSHFDGKRWTITTLFETLPATTSQAVESHPYLFAAPDGSIFLRWNGLWRFDGQHWQDILVNGLHVTRVNPLGVTQNRLWTEWSDSVISNALDGSDSRVYTFANMGLTSPARVYQAIEYGNETLFATDQGLVSFDGTSWIMQKNTSVTVRQIAINPQGNIWLLIGQDNASILFTIVTACGLPLAIIGLFLTVILNTSRNANRLRSAREPLQKLILPVANSQQPRNANVFIIAIIVLFIVEMGAAFMGNMDVVEVVTPIIFVLLVGWMARRIFRSSGTFKQQLRKSVPVLFFAGWICVLWFGLKGLQLSSQGPFFLIMLMIGFIPCAMSIRRYLKRYTGEQAYQHISADNAKVEAGDAQKIPLQYVHASAAVTAGHLEEGEALARTSVAQNQYMNSALLGGSLNTLGLALLYQKHFEEAIQFLEIAIQINPISMFTLTSLAEVYLEAETNMERALEIVEFGLRNGYESWLTKLLKQSSRPTAEGVYAWVLTRLGRFEEADKHIQKALKSASPKNKSSMTYLYFIKGKIEALKGNLAQAAEWFTRASQHDVGLYGQMAANALKEQPTSQ